MKEPLKEPSEEGDDIADESEMVPSEEDSDGGAFSGGVVAKLHGFLSAFFFVFLFTGSFKFPIFVELRVPLRFEVLEGLRT